MASRFRSFIPYAIPGALALLGCWWLSSHRKQQASCHDDQAIGTEEEQQEEVPGDDSSPRREARLPQRLLPDTGSVTAHGLVLEKEAKTAAAFLSNEGEAVSGRKDSAASTLPESLDSACLEQSGEGEISESTAITAPVCQGEDTQAKGDDLERERVGGGSLEEEEAEKIDQSAMQITSKVVLSATEEVLSGSASAVSTQICQAAASQTERPLETASVVSSDQMLAEQAKGVDENLAAKSDAAVLTSLQTEEQDENGTDSSCCTHGHLSIPAEGGTKDCGRHKRSATQDARTEQSSVPSEKPPALKHSGDSEGPYSNGILKKDGPDLHLECSSAARVNGDHLGGKGFEKPPTEICAAPGLDGAWLWAQVISSFEETGEVELRYVDYGGYDRAKIDTLRPIRSDFLSLPFQGAEVFLDNVVPLPGEDHFSCEADAAVSEMTRGTVLVARVTNYDSATGLPLVQLWNVTGDEVVSVNTTLVDRGLARWLGY